MEKLDDKLDEVEKYASVIDRPEKLPLHEGFEGFKEYRRRGRGARAGYVVPLIT